MMDAEIVRHDADREDRKSFERSSREHVEHVQDRSPLLIEQHLKRDRIDAPARE